MSVWKLIDRDLKILRHEDCLGILGYYESLLKEGLTKDDSIPADDRGRFMNVPAGSRVPHLVVRNNIEGTIDKSVVEGFDKLFQEGIKVVGALTNVDGDHKELKQNIQRTTDDILFPRNRIILRHHQHTNTWNRNGHGSIRTKLYSSFPVP